MKHSRAGRDRKAETKHFSGFRFFGGAMATKARGSGAPADDKADLKRAMLDKIAAKKKAEAAAVAEQGEEGGEEDGESDANGRRVQSMKTQVRVDSLFSSFLP